METHDIAAVGYALAMTVMALMAALLLSRWKNSEQSKLMGSACVASAVWGAVLALQAIGYGRNAFAAVGVEWLRNIVWLIGLIGVLRGIDRALLAQRVASGYGFFVLSLVALPFVYYVASSDDPPSTVAIVAFGYLSSVLILSALEQIHRNASVDSRSGVNYFCVAVAGTYLYDLILFVLTIAGVTPENEYWEARGFVNALFAVPLGFGTWRTFRLSLHVQFPRQIVYYTFTLTSIGVFIVLALIGHYYIRAYGGTWGAVASVVFVVGAIALVVVLAASNSIRRRVRVFLMKTFFEYKYDYRKEWLRFIATLSESGLENVPATAVRAVAQIVDSPGGIVWAEDQEGDEYLPIGSWCCEIPALPPLGRRSGLVNFLKDRQWVVDLEEMKRYPARYHELELDEWVRKGSHWWLVVPLFLGDRLFGFILLQKPRVVPGLNFEDHDLLRTVGRHVAMHINQAEVDRRLAESSQFGAYNRLTAFLMHDLNNLIAQQSLVVKNAERFRQNPNFVDDAISTIAHSVTRMKKLMEQLTTTSTVPRKRHTDLRDAVKNGVDRCRTRQPVPTLWIGDGPIQVRADPERLITVFEHLIRNAQDATEASGRISVEARLVNGVANVSISDTGHGMSSEFIRERLFRPFDSTKGSQSMGIGAYQARDYVRALGGQIEVSSELGVGTTFTVRLPVSE